MENVRDLRPEVRQTLERAEKFLGLAALVAVILAAVAVALAASRYLRRHLDAAAMLRCFGAPRRQTLALFVMQFVVLGVVAMRASASLRRARRPGAAGRRCCRRCSPPTCRRRRGRPASRRSRTGVLLLFGFALPPLIALANVPPLRVLRRDLPRPRAGGVARLRARRRGDRGADRLAGARAKAGAIMVGGVGGLLARRGAVRVGADRRAEALPQRGVTWRFGLANLRRRPFASSLQIGALALGLMALLLLTVVRGDLMRNWRASLPPDAPNHFLVNVLPDQVDDVRAQLAKSVGADVAFRPMVRGRLVEVNGDALDTRKYEDTRARRLAEREFNLSLADELPKGNRVVERQVLDAADARGRGGHVDGGRHRRVARREARRHADVRHRGQRA